MVRIAVIHGPNRNLLGLREPEIYGGDDLTRIDLKLQELAKRENMELRITQSNHEGELVEAIHAALGWAQALVINPAAYTHTSVAIRDAIERIEDTEALKNCVAVFADRGYSNFYTRLSDLL